LQDVYVKNCQEVFLGATLNTQARPTAQEWARLAAERGRFGAWIDLTMKNFCKLKLAIFNQNMVERSEGKHIFSITIQV
jgi:hypothetical protein